MAKREFTRLAAGRQAYLDVAGEELSTAATYKEIKAYAGELAEDQRRHCHELYLYYMSLGRPKYMVSYIAHMNLTQRNTPQGEPKWL